MLLKIPLTVIILIYIIFSLISYIGIKSCLKNFINIIERFKKKFPKRTYNQFHLTWVLKIIWKSFFKDSTNKEPRYSLPALWVYSLIKLINLIPILKNKKKYAQSNLITFSVLAFFVIFLIIYSPLMITAIVDKTLFKDNKIISFIIGFAYYLLSYSIFLLVGYGLSSYSSILSIVLIIIFYLIMHLLNGFKQFNKVKTTIYMRIDYYIDLLIGLIISYASIYYNLYQINSSNFVCPHNHFGIVDSIYFSVVTLATVGYGDIVPNSNIAKLVVCSEILAGIFVLIFLASVYINIKIREEKINNQAEIA